MRIKGFALSGEGDYLWLLKQIIMVILAFPTLYKCHCFHERDLTGRIRPYLLLNGWAAFKANMESLKRLTAKAIAVLRLEVDAVPVCYIQRYNPFALDDLRLP